MRYYSEFHYRERIEVELSNLKWDKVLPSQKALRFYHELQALPKEGTLWGCWPEVCAGTVRPGPCGALLGGVTWKHWRLTEACSKMKKKMKNTAFKMCVLLSTHNDLYTLVEYHAMCLYFHTLHNFQSACTYTASNIEHFSWWIY